MSSINTIRIGTNIVRTIPLKTDIITNSFPEDLVIIGNVVSIEVAPAEAIGVILPKYFANNGEANNVIISLNTLTRRAIIPNFSPRNSVINILDKL